MKLLTLARDIHRRKAREKLQLFAAEGVRAVEELVQSPIVIRGVLVAPQLADAPRGASLLDALRARSLEVAEVSAREFSSAAETESPQGVLAIGAIPGHSLNELHVPERAHLVVLDGVQDPGNAGTIIRTAFALGATAVVGLPGTVDLWNAKVVRSAMGACFHLPVLSASWSVIDAFRAANDVRLWGADAAGQEVRSAAAPSRFALVVGNEGAGLTADAQARVDTLVALRMHPRAESLNVAVATGILLYQLRP